MTTPPVPPAGRAGSPYPDQRPSIHDLLDVETVEVGPERVVMRLPVDWRVHQPYGILHGGVSALLAESAASYGASMAAGPGRSVVGIELNCSHLRSVRDGHLTAVATPVRVGRTIQVWHIALSDDDGRAICDARCSLAVIGEPGGAVGAVGTAQAPGNA
ncbi:MAG TPA: PaaI family thioesterase [Acidimicrobiales bacterium]|nr:PaaI family thioesterase [Acidimicrobiales bacterium]